MTRAYVSGGIGTESPGTETLGSTVGDGVAGATNGSVLEMDEAAGDSEGVDVGTGAVPQAARARHRAAAPLRIRRDGRIACSSVTGSCRV